MRKLINWDNHTWLSSKKYISQFNIFLNKKFKFKKEHLVLDIGCGRANIISELHKKYKFNIMPIGIDIIRNNNIKKNIIFRKINGIEYLKKTKKKYNLILLKQTIHFFNSKNISLLLRLSKKRLLPGGMLLIFTLKTKNNQIPCFKKMKNELENSLKRDEILFRLVKKKLKRTKESYFNFKVNIPKKKYLKMVKSKYISCLLDLKNKEISRGISELKSKYKHQIKFTDTLKCISYKR